MRKGKMMGMLFFLGAVFLIGVVLLLFGIKGSISQHKISKEYVQTEGYFTDYEIYSTGERAGRDTNVTYKLTYTYDVDGMSYTVSTDMGMGYVPDHGSTRTVAYDPDDPGKSVLVGSSHHAVLIVMGVLFAGVPLIMFLGFLTGLGYLKQGRIQFMDVVIGGVLLMIGVGVIYVIGGSFSVKDAIVNAGYSGAAFMMFIPILFIIVGALLLIRGFFGSVIKEIRGLK